MQSGYPEIEFQIDPIESEADNDAHDHPSDKVMKMKNFDQKNDTASRQKSAADRQRNEISEALIPGTACSLENKTAADRVINGDGDQKSAADRYVIRNAQTDR